jgi:hypothetical protein
MDELDCEDGKSIIAREMTNASLRTDDLFVMSDENADV